MGTLDLPNGPRGAKAVVMTGARGAAHAADLAAPLRAPMGGAPALLQGPGVLGASDLPCRSRPELHAHPRAAGDADAPPPAVA